MISLIVPVVRCFLSILNIELGGVAICDIGVGVDIDMVGIFLAFFFFRWALEWVVWVATPVLFFGVDPMVISGMATYTFSSSSSTGSISSTYFPIARRQCRAATLSRDCLELS